MGIKTYFLLCALFFSNFSYSAKIAVILRLKDDYSKFPQDILKGMQFALLESGKSKLISLETFSHDGDTASIEKAIISARKINPDIVVGGETSQGAMTIARAFKDKILITPTASTFQLTEVHPSPIRLIHTDDQYVEVVKYLRAHKTLGKVGVFHNISHPNTNRISSKAIEYLKAEGFTPISIEHMNGESIDYEKLKPFIANKIDTLVLFSFESDLRRIYSVFKEHKFHPQYVGGDGWGRDSFLREFLLTPGSNFKGYRALYWNKNSSDKKFIKSKSDLQKYIGNEIDAFHAIGYDTMKLILKNLSNDGTVYDFMNSLKSMRLTGLLTTPVLSYNAKLEPLKEMYIFRVDNSGINFESQVMPK